ncbi:methyl-accepting chemotaxis protein [Streptococcus suis]|uniref:Methyl-accepting chemotaxis protein n=1 Tax=Streptococcus suis TaxID=1307 RepID=A0A0Z8TNF1_STRSU|nr:LPXTG cell wall anchor domain-containing protein [Streptococcus suis]CYX22474.1 methyl-accepting chemotaxis protein [Streptococcus suis]
MSKQKVVTNLLLSTAVLGGFLICHVPSVSAETGNLQEIPTESATVSSENQTVAAVDGISPTDNQLPTSEEGDKQAPEEKLVSSDSTREESAAQVATDPDVPSQSLSVSEAEVSTADSNIQQAEEKLIQESNYYRFDTHQGEQIRNAVSIEKISADNNEIKWKVTFDRKNWTFSGEGSGYYFILPKGLQLTKIIDSQSEEDIFNKFPKDVNSEANSGGQPYRFFSREKNANNDERSFESQWGWSVGRVGGELEKWKEESSSIYFLQVQRDSVAKEKATYELTAQVTNREMQTFPVLAVVKNFKERIFFSRDEITSAAGLRLKVSESAKPNNEGITIIGDSSPESDRTPEPRGDRTPDIDVPKADVPKVEQPKPKAPEVQPPAPKAPESVPPKVMPPAPKVPDVKTPKEAPLPPKTPEVEVPKVMLPTPKVPEVEVPKVIPPTSKVPEAETPKVEQPKPKVPEVHLPAPKAPESVPPKVMPPAPKVPDVKTPKEAPLPPKTPEVEVPKVMLPTPQSPEVVPPKVTPPAPKVPDVKTPKVEHPDTDAPEIESPKSPETERPEVLPPTPKVPEVEPPKVILPTPKAPEAETPKVMLPTPKSPEVAHPDVEKSTGIQPEKGQPEVNKPNIIHPEVFQSEVKKTESGFSPAPKVGIQKETLPNTGETSNTLVWLGGALATLASSLYLFKQHRQREEE